MRLRGGFVMWVALALPGCGAELPPSLVHPLSGAPAPEFAGLATNLRDVHVPADNGLGRVTVVDFWASWCSLCRRTLPAYQEIHEDYRGRGVVVVGVSIDESESAAARFGDSIGAAFPILVDTHQTLARRYGVTKVPLAFVLDREGRVRWIGRDPDDARDAALALLEEP
jgi:cytochrome c biogenesis protein CcmG/thiol:disulfide interchange protein DsbE